MSEQAFQKKILDYLAEKGCYAVKTIVVNRRGIPDILACYKGQFIALEVKDDAGVTRLQELNIEKIRKAGGKAMVIRKNDNWKQQINDMIGE